MRDFRHVFDRLAEAVVIVEADGVGSYANPAAAQVLAHLRRFDLAQPVREADWGVVDATGRPLTGDALPSEITRLTGRELDEVEIGVPTRDGSLRWLRVSTRRLDDAAALPCATVSTYVDVSSRHQLAAELADQRRAHETMVESLAQGVALHAADGSVLESNSSAACLLGLTRDQLHRRVPLPEGFETLDETGRTLERDELPLQLVLAEGVAQRGRIIGLRAPDREDRWLRVNATPLRDAAGELIGAVTSYADITALKQAERQRSEAMRLFETVFSSAPTAVALFDLDMRLKRANDAFYAMLGRDPDELVGQSLHWITHPEDLDADLDLVRQLLAGEISRYAMEKRYRTADGNQLWATLAVSLVRDPDGVPLHFISQIEDITERKRLERELQHMADHDALTGILNRRRFDEALAQQVKRSRRYHERAALLAIDLNEFKAINDTQGHQAGDAVLEAVARALSGRLRATDVVARIGGDEFAVILVNVSVAEAEQLAATLRETIATLRIPVPGTVLSVSASIGVAPIDAATPDANAPLIEADAAMYRDKTGGPLASVTLLPVRPPATAPIIA